MTDEDGGSNVEDTTDVHLHVDELSVEVGCDCCEGPCSATAGAQPESQYAYPWALSEEEVQTLYEATTEGQCHAGDKMLVTPGNQTEAQIRLLQELEEHLRELVDDETNMAADHEPAESGDSTTSRDSSGAIPSEPAWLHDDAPRCPFCKGYVSAELNGSLGSPARFLLECEHCRWDRCYEGEDAQWAAELYHGAL